MPAVAPFVAGFVGLTAPAYTSVAAFGAWTSGVTFAGTIGGTIAAKLLTTVAATALMSVVGKKGVQGGSGGIALSSTLAGDQQDETILLGRYATGGTAICPPMSHGSRNAWMTHVVELCSAPGATLNRLIVNGNYVEIGTTEHPDYGLPVLGEYEGNIWIRICDGRQTTADPMLRDKYGADPDRPWTADMVGHGICYAILTFKMDNSFTSLPSYRFEMDGIPVYDPRRDSSVGGTGPQRWADPATWTQSSNAALLIYNVFRGIPLPSGEVYGGRMPVKDLPLGVWMSAMNTCDIAVETSDGGSEPQYRAGVEIQLSQEPADVIEELLKACSGKVADIGGEWKIRVGGPGLPVMSVTDESLIVTRQQDYDPFPGLGQTFNAVTATFPDPESVWETRDAPPRYSEELEAQDRFGRKAAAITLPAVPYPLQVQRLMRGWIEAERRFRKHTNTLPPFAAPLEPLDVIAWTSGRNGYVEKLFDIDQAAVDPILCLSQISTQEVDPADYSWVPGFELPTTTPAPGVTPPPPVAVPDFQLEGTRIRDAEGRDRRPALKLKWANDFDRATAIKWELRLSGTSEVVLRGTTRDLEAGYAIVADGILPDTLYDGRAFPYLPDVRGAWSAWATARTPDVRLTALDVIYGDGTVEEITERLEALSRFAGEDARRLADALRRVMTQAMDADAAAFTQRQQLRRELVATVGRVTAAYREEIDVAAGPGSALVRRVETLAATVEDPASGVAAIGQALSGLRVQVTALESLAQAVTDLQAAMPGKASATALSALEGRVGTAEGNITATSNALIALDSAVGRFSAGALFRAETRATGAGAQSTVAFYVTATAGEGTGRAAAFYLEAIAGNKSRALFDVDSFAIMNGNARQSPFVVENGEVRMGTAVVNNLIVRGSITTGAVSDTWLAEAATEQSASDNTVVLQLSLGSIPAGDAVIVQSEIEWRGTSSRMSLFWEYQEDGLWLVGGALQTPDGRSAYRTGYLNVIVPGGGPRRVSLSTNSNGITYRNRRIRGLTVKK